VPLQAKVESSLLVSRVLERPTLELKFRSVSPTATHRPGNGGRGFRRRIEGAYFNRHVRNCFPYQRLY
jgi:hypothetical protein